MVKGYQFAVKNSSLIKIINKQLIVEKKRRDEENFTEEKEGDSVNCH